MPTTQSNGVAVNELEAECRRLREIVEQLQSEHARDRNEIVALRAERDAYLHALYAWSRAQVSEEQLRNWATDEKTTGESFEQIMAELTASQPL